MHACFIVLQLRSDSCQIHGYVMLKYNKGKGYVKASHIRYRVLGPALIPMYRQSARK